MIKTTADYVRMLKDKYGLTSNYQVANFLQMNQTTVSNWTRGRSTLDDVSAVIIAEKLEIDPEIIVTACHYERAEKQGNEMVAGVYKKMLKTLEKAGTTGAAATVTVLVLNGILPF